MTCLMIVSVHMAIFSSLLAGVMFDVGACTGNFLDDACLRRKYHDRNINNSIGASICRIP